MIILNIEEKLVEEEQLAIINYRGPPEDMANLINELSAWAEDHKIDVTGPPFAIYYSTPKEGTEDITYDVGLSVQGEVEGSGKIIIATVPEHKVISAVHKGQYSDLKDTYQTMVEFVLENNYDIIGSPKEIYLNSPEDVSTSELMTEIQFPVIKMG